jgi:hypothetical protein
MLPKDAEKRRKDARAKNQPRLDAHLKEMPQKVPMTPYTDGLFRKAAIEWLASTDQVRDCSTSIPYYFLIHVTAHSSVRTLFFSKHDPDCGACHERG